MPLEEIRKDIEATAHADAERMKKEADSDAKMRIRNAEEKAGATAAEAEAWTKSETERLRKEHEASLEIETHNMMLEAMDEVVRHHVKSVKKQIAKRVEEEHMREILKAALAKFAESVPIHEVTLTTGRANAKLIDSIKPKCEVRYGNVDGTTLRSKDGRIALELNAETMVDSQEDEIKGIMTATLFAGQKEAKHKEAAPKVKTAKKPAKAKKAVGKRRVR